MQTKLPFFPEKTKMINDSTGFFESGGIVYYLHCGNPVHCHKNDDHNSYRFIIGNLVVNKRCTITELSDAMGVPRKNIERYAKAFREKGADHFFNRIDNRGQCYRMTPDKITAIQSDLDSGLSVYRASQNNGISEAAINYHIKKGNLKKKTPVYEPVDAVLSTPYERNGQYLQSAGGMGMATSRAEERIMSALGLSAPVPVKFESCQAIPMGGVLFLLPFLFECGLMSYNNHYSQRQRGYYNFDNLFIIIALIYLCRIKSFEQIKQYSPGEFGKLVGYDRIPEVKTLRGMIGEITAQKCADKWVAALSQNWICEEEPEVYYIDGHVQVYHGYLANLGKKHVSRQKLCLPGAMEFWVNAFDGSPYFYITADVNEKMIEMLTGEIVPQLLELHPVSEERKKLVENDPDEPLFTLVFDREAYSPDFFAELWKKRIAVITYRKNVKDVWDENLFEDYDVPTACGNVKMKLLEQDFTTPDGRHTMREVRKLNDDGHQTSIVSTNKKLSIILIASYMFARWAQENFFRYMRQDYALDKIIQYSVDELDASLMVVNPDYNNINGKIKKEREKLGRRKAKLYEYDQKNPLTEENEKENKIWIKNRLLATEEVHRIEQELENLIQKRKEIPYKISIGKMPESKRYNQLNQESKLLQNIIKIICYRAETALAALLSPHFNRAEEEIRMLIKSIIKTPINMLIDNEKGELKITLYSLSNKRSNDAVYEICETINKTNTVYPGTNLKLIYEITTF